MRDQTVTIGYANTTDMIRRVAMKVWRTNRRDQGISEDAINYTLSQWVNGETSLCLQNSEILKELERIEGPRHALKKKL